MSDTVQHLKNHLETSEGRIDDLSEMNALLKFGGVGPVDAQHLVLAQKLVLLLHFNI